MSSATEVQMNRHGITVGKKAVTLYGSEFFYFRFDRDRWPTVLDALVTAGCDAVSLPIPWNWHLLDDGTFDFTGRTDDRRDLHGALAQLAVRGIRVIARPGPYICAEWDNGGIPQAVLDAHPEILAVDAEGHTLSKRMDAYPVITSLHPTFLAATASWLDAVCPILVENQATVGGPIVSVEIDDEPSYWLTVQEPLRSDFNPIIVGSDGLYGRWLGARYERIGALNDAYATEFRSFDLVEPLRKRPTTMADFPRAIDWHLFKLDMINEYIECLYHLLQERGVSVPLSLLDPYLDFDLEGWERFRRHCEARQLAIRPLTELYPSGVWEAVRTSHIKEEAVQYVAGKLAIYRRLADLMDGPRICVEAQAAGTYRLDSDEADLFYHLLLAHGLDHLIYWAIPAGTNPPGRARSFTGTSNDTSNAIGPDGSPRPHLEVISRLGRFLHDDPLTGLEVQTDIGLGFYEPYRALSHARAGFEAGLRDDVADTLRQAFFPSPYGLVSLLSLAGVTFDAIMVEGATVEELLAHSQIWMFSLEIMDAETQARLLEYVERGGHLVLLPRIPTRDLNGGACTILADAIGAGAGDPVSGTVFDWMDTPRSFVRYDSSPPEVLVFDYAQTFEPKPDAEPIVWVSRTGATTGFATAVGRGEIVVLGFKPGYTNDGLGADRGLIWHLLERAGIRRSATASSRDILVVQRWAGDGGYLFVMNPGGWPTSTTISYRDPSSGESHSIPRRLDAMGFSARGGLILPINRMIPDSDVRIAYATSEIVNARAVGDGVVLHAHGQIGTRGELALHGLTMDPVVTLDGRRPDGGDQSWDAESGTLTLTYDHGRPEIEIVVSK